MISLSIIITGVIIISSVIWETQKSKNVLNPFYFVATICFMVQVIGPFYWVISGQSAYRGVEIMRYMPMAELVFCLGYITLWLIFAKTRAKPSKIRGVVYSCKNDVYIDCREEVLFLMLVCFFAIYALYLIRTGRSLVTQFTFGQYGEFSENLVASEGIQILFFALGLNAMITSATLLLFISKKKIRFLIYAVVLILTVSSGKRHLMLDVVLAPLICFYSIKQKKPRPFIVVIGFIICYLLVGWIGAMRSVYRTGTGTLYAFDNKSAWAAVLINLEVFMPLCMYIPRFTSLSSFSYGTTYIIAFLQLIPSFILPFKGQLISLLSTGISSEVLGSKFLSEGIAGTFWSGLYSNGWIFGVMIGMGLLGKWIKNLFEKPKTKRITYIVEYSVTTAFLFQFLTRSFGNALQDYVGLMIPLFILRRIK